MRVKVKDLEFNPFRNIKLIPIDKVTVEKLKDSIKDLGLWAGMTARPKNNDLKSDKYQIPFGHHRLVAIRELGIEEIEISVNEISDFNMVLMMVQENMTQRGVSVEMINGTIREVKEFLDAEIAKYKSWEEACANEIIITKLVENAKGWVKVRDQGVGQTTILKFLKGAIPQWRIASALDLIKSNDIESEAINILDSTGQAEGFKKAIRKVNKERIERGEKPIPKDGQKKLAEKIKGTKSEGRTGGGNYYSSMENIIRQEVNGTDEFETALNEIRFNLDGICNDSRKLGDKISNLNGKLYDMGVEELKMLSSLDLINNFSKLLTNINVLSNTLGVQFNKLNE